MFILAQKTGIVSVALIISALSTLGTGHVIATSYLFTDRKVRGFIANDPIRFIFIPVAMIVMAIVSLLYSPLWVAFVFVLIYIHYQAYHYGQQNLGVATFSSIASRRTGMSLFERGTIRLGVLCGVMGTYKALWPNLMVGGPSYPFDLSLTDKIFWPLFYVSGAIYGGVLIAAGIHVVVCLRQWPRYALLYFCSVAFFVPIYLSTDIYLTFFSYAIAHGLQYLVFLGFHTQGRGNKFVVGSCAVLLVATVAGAWLWGWNHMDSVIAVVLPKDTALRAASGVIFGFTMAHFWFDQYLWKLRLSDRREWVKERYPFLF